MQLFKKIDSLLKKHRSIAHGKFRRYISSAPLLTTMTAENADDWSRKKDLPNSEISRNGLSLGRDLQILRFLWERFGLARRTTVFLGKR